MATITGTSGNDTITMNDYEDDDIFGLGGNDIYKYYFHGWSDRITDTGGNDKLQFNHNLNYKTTALIKDGNNLIIDLQGSGDVTIVDHYTGASTFMESISFNGLFLTMSASNLIVTEKLGTNNYTVPDGTSGSDLMFVGVGEDQFLATYPGTWGIGAHARAGNDTIIANYASFVWAGEGNDTVYGHAATIWLGKGDDTLYAELNALYQTSAYGGDGSDKLYGSSGNDQLRGDHENGESINDITAPGNDIIYGYGGDDSINGNQGDDDLFGGDGNDSIQGEDGNDEIYGNAGNDYLWGGNGTDLIYGGDGSDTINAADSNGQSTGNKTLYGEAGNDTINGGNGNDIISGGEGNDIIYSVNGSDSVNGDNGDDYITVFSQLNQTMNAYGSYANDTLKSVIANSVNNYEIGTTNLYGGEGNDIYQTNTTGTTAYINFGNINIFDQSGSGDKFHLVNGTYSSLNFTSSGNNLVITSDIDLGTITIQDHFVRGHHIEEIALGNVGEIDEIRFSLIESLTSGNDTYTASTSSIGSERNIIDGSGGVDTIHGANGDDLIYGGTDNDTLYGDAGNDVLYGDLGSDTLYGGANADTFGFIFETAFSNLDSIMDFSLAQNDKLHIGDLLNAYDPLTQAITDFVQITDNGVNSSVYIDSDGTGSTYSFTQIATLYGVTGLTDEDALETSGHLITARS